MIKYKSLYAKEYNKTQSASLANSLALLFGAEVIGENTAPEIIDLVNCAKRVDKALIYCPVSLAEWVANSDVVLKNKLLSIAPLEVNCVANSSRKNFYNILNMLSGKLIRSKDIKNGELIPQTIFDGLTKTKKRSLIISTASNSFNDLFKQKPVDLIKVKSGAESINTALKFLKENIYDFIFVIDSDYDDCIRLGLPLSKASQKVYEKQVERFSLLNDATDVYWQGDILLGFCPDKGCHRGLFTGKSGSISVADLNVVHYYSVKS